MGWVGMMVVEWVVLVLLMMAVMQVDSIMLIATFLQHHLHHV
jgi:hypothetical protein